MEYLQTDVHRHSRNHLSMLWVGCGLTTAFGTAALNISISFFHEVNAPADNATNEQKKDEQKKDD